MITAFTLCVVIRAIITNRLKQLWKITPHLMFPSVFRPAASANKVGTTPANDIFTLHDPVCHSGSSPLFVIDHTVIILNEKNEINRFGTSGMDNGTSGR